MILLDTNVLSEMMRAEAALQVEAWIDSQLADELYLSAVALAELHAGIDVLPVGSRRARLELSLERVVTRGFRGRVAPFGEAEAAAFGRVVARRSSIGRPIDRFDAMIAATAIAHGATLATRNVRDFEGLDIALVNPFEHIP